MESVVVYTARGKELDNGCHWHKPDALGSIHLSRSKAGDPRLIGAKKFPPLRSRHAVERSDARERRIRFGSAKTLASGSTIFSHPRKKAYRDLCSGVKGPAREVWFGLAFSFWPGPSKRERERERERERCKSTRPDPTASLSQVPSAVLRVLMQTILSVGRHHQISTSIVSIVACPRHRVFVASAASGPALQRRGKPAPCSVIKSQAAFP